MSGCKCSSCRRYLSCSIKKRLAQRSQKASMLLILMIPVCLIHRDLLFQDVRLQLRGLRRIGDRGIDERSNSRGQFRGLDPERIGEMKDLRFHVVVGSGRLFTATSRLFRIL